MVYGMGRESEVAADNHTERPDDDSRRTQNEQAGFSLESGTDWFVSVSGKQSKRDDRRARAALPDGCHDCVLLDLESSHWRTVGEMSSGRNNRVCFSIDIERLVYHDAQTAGFTIRSSRSLQSVRSFVECGQCGNCLLK